MRFKVSFEIECISAVVADISIGVNVDGHMLLDVALLLEVCVAERALEVARVVVHALVLLQLLLGPEGLAARGARMRLLLRVPPLVPQHRAHLSEPGLTDGTCVRSFTGVDSHVDHDVAFRVESFPAVLADEPPLSMCEMVSLGVPLQRAAVLVPLVAGGALEGLLPRVRAHVRGERGGAGARTTAHCTVSIFL